MTESFYLTLDGSRPSEEIREIVRKAVEAKVRKMHAKHAVWIYNCLGKVMSSETITPVVAFNLNIEFFWVHYFETHAPLKESTQKTYEREMFGFLEFLPERPMVKYSDHLIQKALKEHSISKTVQRLLRAFWQYCLDNLICIGTNMIPVPLQDKREEEQNKAYYLYKCWQEKVYAFALKHHRDPMIPGLAMQLWGGLDAESLPHIHWGELLWGTAPPSVKLKDIDDNRAGAIKDFTKPFLPQCYLLLKIHHDHLLNEKGTSKKKLDELPIVNIDGKTVDGKDITSYNRSVMRELGYEEELAKWGGNSAVAHSSKKLFTNTYAHILNEDCGIDESSDMMAFLCGRTPKSSTGEFYVSFTDHLGSQHIQSYLNQSWPEMPLEQPPPELLPAGRTCQTYLPETNKLQAHLTAEVLPDPGEEVEIYSPSGTTGDLKSRPVTKVKKAKKKRDAVPTEIPGQTSLFPGE